MGTLRERPKCLVWWYRVLCVKGVKNRRDFHVSSWVGLELTPNYLLLSLITTTLVLYSKEIKEGKDSFFSYQCQRRIFKYWSCGLVNNNLSTAFLYAKFFKMLRKWIKNTRGNSISLMTDAKRLQSLNLTSEKFTSMVCESYLWHWYFFPYFSSISISLFMWRRNKEIDNFLFFSCRRRKDVLYVFLILHTRSSYLDSFVCVLSGFLVFKVKTCYGYIEKKFVLSIVIIRRIVVYKFA